MCVHIVETMKLLIFLFTCIAMTASDHGCAWTGCEGWARTGASVCHEYYKPIYTGNTAGGDCAWDATKYECCQPTPSRPGCRWTTTCYGTAYSGAYACSREFGSGFSENDKLVCFGFQLAYECCSA